MQMAKIHTYIFKSKEYFNCRLGADTTTKLFITITIKNLAKHLVYITYIHMYIRKHGHCSMKNWFKG